MTGADMLLEEDNGGAAWPDAIAAGAGQALDALIPEMAGAYAAGALTDADAFYLPEPLAGTGSDDGGGLYGTRYVLTLLRRDEPDRALVSFYGMLAQGFTRDTFIAGEGSSLTPLDARGTVVLRYRTGDYLDGGLTYATCPRCGRQVPRLVGKISRSSAFKEVQLDKIKGTLVDFNELEHVLDDAANIGAWQLELRKLHDDPLEVDELILHVQKTNGADDEHLAHELLGGLGGSRARLGRRDGG